MSFLRTFVVFVFVFSLVGISGSYAGKIKNCSNCNSDVNVSRSNAEKIKSIQDFQDCKNSIHELDSINPLQNVTNYDNYLWGNNGFKQNEDKAKDNLLKSACKGLDTGIAKLARAYYSGDLLEKNHRKSLILYLFLHNKGHDVASKIAHIYLDNEQVKKDCEIAANWIIKSKIQRSWYYTPFKHCPWRIKRSVKEKTSHKPSWTDYRRSDESKFAKAAWSFFRKGDIENSILEFQKHPILEIHLLKII